MIAPPSPPFIRLSLNVELNYETPIENCAAILDALEKYRHYKK